MNVFFCVDSLSSCSFLILTCSKPCCLAAMASRCNSADLRSQPHPLIAIPILVKLFVKISVSSKTFNFIQTNVSFSQYVVPFFRTHLGTHRKHGSVAVAHFLWVCEGGGARKALQLDLCTMLKPPRRQGVLLLEIDGEAVAAQIKLRAL